MLVPVSRHLFQLLNVHLAVRPNPLHSYTKVSEGIAPSDSRSFGECLEQFTTLDRISNDPLEVCSAQVMCLNFRSPTEIASGTSGRAFTNSMDFTGILIGTALTGMPVFGTAFTGVSLLSALGIMFAQARNLSLPDLEKDIEFLDMEQNF